MIHLHVSALRMSFVHLTKIIHVALIVWSKDFIGEPAVEPCLIDPYYYRQFSRSQQKLDHIFPVKTPVSTDSDVPLSHCRCI